MIKINITEHLPVLEAVCRGVQLAVIWFRLTQEKKCYESIML